MRINSHAFQAACLIMWAATAGALRAQTSSITYQGHLMDAGVSANASYDIRLTLKNAATAGSNVVPPVATSPVTAVNGLFTLSVDFGSAAFDGSDRWLEVSVRPAGSSGAYTILAPRQKLSASPYALKSLKAGTADSATAANSAALLTGVLTSANVSTGFISSTMIASGAVQAAHVETGAIGSAQLAAGSVSMDKIRASLRAGSLGDGMLAVTAGVLSFSTTYPLPFTGQPSVTLASSWAQGSSTQAGFSATTALNPVTVGTVGAFEHVTSIRLVNGRPAIAYSSMSQLRYARALDAAGTSWGAHVTVDSSSNAGQHCSMEIVNGRPAITYYDAGAGRLKYVIASDADGTAWGTPVVVDSSANVGQYTALAVVNERPAISYYDVTNGNLKYVRAADTDGSAWNTPFVVESTGDTGLHTCLRMVNTRPAISYYDQTLGVLKFVRASTLNGTAWDAPVTVDNAADAGRHTSLAIINGMPAISYVRTTGVDLRYVRATNANGGAWGAPLTLDSAGSAGSHGSLEVLGGMPVIFYHDATNGDLKFISGRDVDGAAWGAPTVLDAAGTVGRFTSVVVHQGRAFASYTDTTNNSVKHLSMPELPWSVRDDTVVPIVASSVAAGGITSAQLAPGSVGSQQLAPGSVGFSSLAKPPQAGGIALSALEMDFGDLSFSADFSQGYSTPPVVTTSLMKSAAGSLPYQSVVVESVTGSGFSGKLLGGSKIVRTVAPADGITTDFDPAMAMVNGRPAIVWPRYVSLLRAKALFSLAADSSGTSWQAPVEITGAPLATGDGVGLAEVAGRPALAVVNAQDDLVFYRSNLADGQENAWPSVVVDTSALADESNVNLLVIDGNPAMSYVRAEEPYNLRYVRATSADGSAWGAPVDVVTSAAARAMSMRVVAGRPAIACILVDTSGTAQLAYVRANNTSGASWSAPVLLTNLAHQVREMAVVGNHPAICYIDASGVLAYVRAANPEGSVWLPPVQITASNLTQPPNPAVRSFSASMCDFHGTPAITYYHSEGKLFYLRADDAAGTSWRTPVVLSEGGYPYYGGSKLTIVNDRPAASFLSLLPSGAPNPLQFITAADVTGGSVNWIALPP